MVEINENYAKLPGSYLFSEIARRTAAFSEAHPEANLIKMGIGDVTRPLAPAVIEAMHGAVDDLSRTETFAGYGPEQGYAFLRDAIAKADYNARGVDIAADEIFVSDGAKSDCGNIGDILGPNNVVAVCDVDSNHLNRAGDEVPGAKRYADWRELLDKEGDNIDSINIAVPDHSHAGYVLDALARGLNVYGQKPLCHDIADCRRIESLAAEKKAVTQMGTQIAARPCDRQTVAFLKSGLIGELRHVWVFSNRGGQTTADHTWPLAWNADRAALKT